MQRPDIEPRIDKFIGKEVLIKIRGNSAHPDSTCGCVDLAIHGLNGPVRDFHGIIAVPTPPPSARRLHSWRS